MQPGEVRVLRGKGMPVLQGFGRGDHRVLVNVSVPRRLTDEQRRLLEEFESISDDGHLPARRELLREAEERVPVSGGCGVSRSRWATNAPRTLARR